MRALNGIGRGFWIGKHILGVAGDVEGMYDARKSPHSRSRNNFSRVVFRKEKDRESPRSSGLES